ncbi:hypothetical protein ACFL3C_02410 [Patescibacteria group bacterium]
MKKRLKRLFGIRKGKLPEVLYVVGVCVVLTLFIRFEITIFIAIVALFLILRFNPVLPALIALFCVISWPIFTVLEKEDWAEKTGFISYYLIFTTVFLFILYEATNKRGRPKKEAKKPLKRKK